MPRKTDGDIETQEPISDDVGLADSGAAPGDAPDLAAAEAADVLGLQGAASLDGLADRGMGGFIDDPADLTGLGGASGPPDLGVGDEAAVDDLWNPGGSTLFDDLRDGATGSWDPLGGVGSDLPGADGGGGWDSPIDDQSGFAMDGAGSFPYGSGPPDVGQWDTVESSSPWGGTDTVTTWEPAIHADDSEMGQSNEHGPEQSGGSEVPGTDDPWFGNNAESPDGGQGAARVPHQTSDQPRQHDEDPYDDDPDDEGSDSGESQGHHVQGAQVPSQESTPIPDEAGGDFGGGSGTVDPGPSPAGTEINPLDTGNVDPTPDSDSLGGGADAGDLDTVRAGMGAVDPDPDLDDAGDGGGLDLERLGFGAIDPVGGESTLLDDDPGDMTEALADIGGDDVEIDIELVAEVEEVG